MDNFEDGFCYKLVNNLDDDFYVGSSVLTEAKRFATHKAKAPHRPTELLYKKMLEQGMEHWSILRIDDDYIPNSKEDLRNREQYWIDTLKPTLNTNDAVRDEEYYKERQREHTKVYKQTEKGKETVKKYNQSEAHKKCRDKYRESAHGFEKEQNYKLQYKADHAEEIKAYQREYMKKYKIKRGMEKFMKSIVTTPFETRSFDILVDIKV